MEPTPNATRDAAAQQYEAAAAELERAAAHLRWTATHFRNAEVPRGCAHAFAAIGHISTVQQQINALAVIHAARAQI